MADLAAARRPKLGPSSEVRKRRREGNDPGGECKTPGCIRLRSKRWVGKDLVGLHANCCCKCSQSRGQEHAWYCFKDGQKYEEDVGKWSKKDSGWWSAYSGSGDGWSTQQSWTKPGEGLETPGETDAPGEGTEDSTRAPEAALPKARPVTEKLAPPPVPAQTRNSVVRSGTFLKACSAVADRKNPEDQPPPEVKE